MIMHRLTANLRAQNWMAIGIEVLIVVIGVFIGTQVSNWNQERIDRRETERMLEQFRPSCRPQITNVRFTPFAARSAQRTLLSHGSTEAA